MKLPRHGVCPKKNIVHTIKLSSPWFNETIKLAIEETGRYNNTSNKEFSNVTRNIYIRLSRCVKKKVWHAKKEMQNKSF